MMSLLSHLMISLALASSTVRLDKNIIEEVIPFTHKYELIIEENCGYCLNQLSIMKNCLEEKDVIVFMENKFNSSEEKLKKMIRRKKIIYKTYILTEDLKKSYNFKGVTPMMWINKGLEKKSYTGVVSCEALI